MWNYEEAVQHLEDCYIKGKKDGLRGMAAMMEKLGQPQKKLKFVHITGTNGKGSTSMMISGALTAAGYRTGVFISPHVDDFRERIQIDGEMISKEEFASLYRRVVDAAEELEREGRPYPSEFEMITCCGLTYFAEKQCEIVVLEVGIGGAKDATNIVENTEAAVFAPISLDHMNMLGETTADIAGEKSGILKPGCGAVTCWEQDQEAQQVLEEACKNLKIRLITARRPSHAESSPAGNKLIWNGETYSFGLPGAYQIQNACTALETLDLLRSRGWNIPEEAVQKGFASLRFNARIEVISQDPLVILDGSHNPAGVDVLVNYMENQLKGQKITLVLGMLSDKTHGPCIHRLAKAADRVAAVTIDYYRALASEETAREAKEVCDHVETFPTVAAGLEWALEHPEGPIIVCGSLYIPGEARQAFQNWKTKQEETTMNTREIYLAGGCYWGTEKYMASIKGVVDTVVGFANGKTEQPTYAQVCHDNTDHAETVHVVYDPQQLPLKTLLKLFYKIIDPTSVNKQGEDEGRQYRTGIYFTDPADEAEIRQSLQELQAGCGAPLAIEACPLQQFWPAEEYHQKYLDKNPTGYCHVPWDLIDWAETIDPLTYKG